MFEGDPFDGGDPKYEQPLYLDLHILPHTVQIRQN